MLSVVKGGEERGENERVGLSLLLLIVVLFPFLSRGLFTAYRRSNSPNSIVISS